MSWRAAENDGIWTLRAAISIPDAVGVAASDVDVTIPPEFDRFWDTIDDDGFELRVFGSAGGAIEHTIDDGSGGAFDAAAREGRLRLNNVPLPNVAGSVACIWLHFKPTTTQGDGSVAFVPAAPITGYIELSAPGEHRYTVQADQAGQSRPRFTFNKRPIEYRHVWLEFSQVLQGRVSPAYGFQQHEEVWFATQECIDTAAASVPGMVDTPNMRWVWTDDGSMWFRMPIQSGTDDNNYTALADVRTLVPGGTSLHQRIGQSIGVRVRATRFE